MGGIYSVLRSEIRSGGITTDDLLSEEILMHRFQATRGAVREALRMLATEGILRRSPRSGTRLVRSPVRINAGDDMPDMTVVGADELDIESLDVALVPTPPWVAVRFMGDTDRVIRLEQLVRLNSSPVIWRVAFMRPPEGDPDAVAFTESIRRASSSPMPLDANFRDLFGSPMGRVDTTTEAVPCDAAMARILDIEENAPVLLRELRFHDADDGVVAVGFQYCRGDRVTIVTEAAGRR